MEMFDFIREHIGIIGRWGNLILISLLICGFAALWFSGRRGRFLIPPRLTGKLLSFTIAVCILAIGAVLVLLNGPLSPFINSTYKLDQTQGRVIPEITFRLIDDDSEHRVSEFRGRVIVLNLWATWCPPCVGEMDTLNRLQAAGKDRGYVVITLSDESRDTLLKFSKEHPLETVSGYVASFDWLQMETFRPYTLIIDRQGILREHIFGTQDYESFVRTVQKYTSEP